MKLSIYPTLVECFGIIFIGYVAGKFNFVTTTQSKGISLFISQIALPALILKAMIEVNFYVIDWHFWTALLISKTLIFAMVAVLTYFFQKRNPVGKAGIFGLFVTQSNDFAFGLPILTAIFNSPENTYLVNYLYLVAPINLAILNPLAFSLLEYQRAKNDARVSTENLNDSKNNLTKEKTVRNILIHTIKGIATNPLVFMIVFGIAGNFIFKQHIPDILGNFFGSLSKAFSASALFYLGLCLRGTNSKSSRSAWILPTVLVAVKGILMPILMRQMVTAIVFNPDDFHSNNDTLKNQTLTYTEEVSAFAFIYGSIPTAPTVIIFASKYNMAEDMIAAGLLRGTVLSLPVIFCSMKMLQVKRISDLTAFTSLIGEVSSNVSIVSALCCVWVMIVFVLLRLYKSVLHRFTFALIIFQFLLGIMGALFGIYSNTKDIGTLKFSIWLLLFAFCGCFTWTTIVSIVIMLNAWGRMGMVGRWHRWILVTGFIIPSVFATILLVTTPENKLWLERNSTNFLQFQCIDNHESFAVVFIIMGLVSLTLIMAAIIKLKWPTASNEQVSLMAQDERYEDDVQPLIEADDDSPSASVDIPNTLEYNDEHLKVETESLDSDSCMVNKTPAMENVSTDIRNIMQMENIDVNSVDVTIAQHTTSHVILLLLLGFSILLDLILKFWHILMDDGFTKGIYLELKMLSSVLLHGQGFFSFLVFGFLKEIFMLPVFERIYYVCTACMCKKTIRLKERSELDANVLLLCDRFTRNHLRWCAGDIVTNLKIRSKIYNNVFTGRSLTNWLIESGLVTDRTEAIHFGNHLLQGCVIEHYAQRHHFYDLPYLYRFKFGLVSYENLLGESQD